MKNQKLVLGALLAAAFVVVAAGSYMIGRSVGSTPVSEDYVVVDSGEGGADVMSLDAGEQALTITSQKEQNEVLSPLYADYPTALAETDLDDYDLVLVTTETKPTGGYFLSFISVYYDLSDKLIVEATLTEPGSTCITTQALTRPYALIRVPKDSRNVEVEVKYNIVVRECD